MINEKLSRNYSKVLSSLALKKFRQKYQLFIVEGEKIVGELMASNARYIKELVVREGYGMRDDIYKKFNILHADESQFSKISSMSTPPPVLAVCYMDEYLKQPSPATSHYDLYLDDIRDPGNAGTIIRTAEWFGFNRVYFSPQSTDIFHPRLIQATMGSLFRVFCRELEREKINTLPKPYIGATLKGQPLTGIAFPAQGTLIIGNESNGISREILDILDMEIKIGAHPSNQAESLNVGMAAAILMHQLSIQYGS